MQKSILQCFSFSYNKICSEYVQYHHQSPKIIKHLIDFLGSQQEPTCYWIIIGNDTTVHPESLAALRQVGIEDSWLYQQVGIQLQRTNICHKILHYHVGVKIVRKINIRTPSLYIIIAIRLQYIL
ncbi:Hypothetical_protein [Hexamita inflata]|uniref:Hypothetical_protein n=1 Tax=Hexamita inflata TaxID=28002 RepID=A0AA86TWQ1_9EUKA|nr:Hypothetical protein HINF_LOCUS11793 [Hexamita inflata]